MGEILDQTEHYTLLKCKCPTGYVLEVRGPNLERAFSVPVQVYEKDLKRMLKSGIAYVDSRCTMQLTYYGTVVEEV